MTYTFGQLLDRYLTEYLPDLAWSTQQTNRSLIELHVRLRWHDMLVTDMKALRVKAWVDKMPVGPASKARVRNLILKLLNLAVL